MLPKSEKPCRRRDALRRWFGHDPAKWDRFKQRYHAELAGHSEAVERLLAKAKTGPVTLVFAARDAEHNNAVALKEYLDSRPARSSGHG